jgi:hypothetical protein
MLSRQREFFSGAIVGQGRGLVKGGEPNALKTRSRARVLASFRALRFVASFGGRATTTLGAQTQPSLISLKKQTDGTPAAAATAHNRSVANPRET